MSWAVWQNPDGEVHVGPVGDYTDHVLSQSCWCRPRVDSDGVVIHHSLDGREQCQAMTYWKGQIIVCPNK